MKKKRKVYILAFKLVTVSDALVDSSLSPIDGLPPSPSISIPFDSSSFKLKDFEKIIQTRRNASAPGINMIPYKVYKKCPQLMSFLFKLCLSCQRNQVIPIYWRIAHEVYIPKNKPPNPSSIKDFRPISLMNVEGKLFFSLVSQRFVSHIIKKQQVRQCFYSERLYGKDSGLLGAYVHGVGFVKICET